MDDSKIKFSCSDFTFPSLPHHKSLQLIKLMGIDAVDLSAIEGRSHLSNEIAKNPSKAAQKFRRILNDIGLEAVDVFVQTAPVPTMAAANTPDAATHKNNRYVFQKTLDFTRALGCKHMTGKPGVLHKGVSYDQDWGKSCEETVWRMEKAAKHGITYAIEPHIGSIVPDVKTVHKFINDAPGTTLTLDYSHFIYQGEDSETVHSLLPFASHMHVRGASKGQLQTTVDNNTIDFAGMMSKLRDIDYANYICLEYLHNDFDDCNETDNVSETMRLLELLQPAK
ncbi:sugar phosphate isomerase/epimerase family protein [Bacteroidota bacterium]